MSYLLWYWLHLVSQVSHLSFNKSNTVLYCLCSGNHTYYYWLAIPQELPIKHHGYSIQYAISRCHYDSVLVAKTGAQANMAQSLRKHCLNTFAHFIN